MKWKSCKLSTSNLTLAVTLAIDPLRKLPPPALIDFAAASVEVMS
jgi:hypothetical protein